MLLSRISLIKLFAHFPVFNSIFIYIFLFLQLANWLIRTNTDCRVSSDFPDSSVFLLCRLLNLYVSLYIYVDIYLLYIIVEISVENRIRNREYVYLFIYFSNTKLKGFIILFRISSTRSDLNTTFIRKGIE